jgi:hypothetical protein
MLFLFSILLSAALTAAPQNSFGTIEGTVLQANSTGLAGALIQVEGIPAQSPVVWATEITTGANGRYSLSNVPAGNYGIQIHKDGLGYRQTSPRFSTSVTLAPGERVRLPAVTLFVPSTIRGRILDSDDKGVSFVAVELLRMAIDNSGRKIWSLQDRTLTGTEGNYKQRVFGPGDYYVRAVLDSGPARLSVYYPATTDAGKAAPLIVAEGVEAVADIRVDPVIHESKHRISGKVTLPPLDAAAPFIQLSLTPRDPGGPVETAVAPYSQTSTRADEGVGVFEFPDVRPGNYEVSASVRVNARTYSGRVPVEIRDKDLDGVELVVHPPVAVKGRLVIDGPSDGIYLASRAPRTARALSGLAAEGHTADVALNLVFRGTSGRIAVALLPPSIDSEGTAFSFSEVDEGEYQLGVTLQRSENAASQNLYIADIRAGGRSVIDSGFEVGIDNVDLMEVVIGTQGGVIEGRIVGLVSSEPIAVVVMPEKSHRENASRYRTVPVSGAGPFRIEGLAPGNYQVFAVPNNGRPVTRATAEYESKGLNIVVQKGKTSGALEIPYLAPDK